jgi:hypothetical protein
MRMSILRWQRPTLSTTTSLANGTESVGILHLPSPTLTLLANHLLRYPSPANLSYFWNFGFLSAVCLGVQLITGVLLAMHYNSGAELAFASVEHLGRDVSGGWLLRFLHANGAAFFFIAVVRRFTLIRRHFGGRKAIQAPVRTRSALSPGAVKPGAYLGGGQPLGGTVACTAKGTTRVLPRRLQYLWLGKRIPFKTSPGDHELLSAVSSRTAKAVINTGDVTHRPRRYMGHPKGASATLERGGRPKDTERQFGELGIAAGDRKVLSRRNLLSRITIGGTASR